MPYPNEPTLDYSYTGFEQAQGDGSFPGQEVDVDLANLRTSIVEIIAFLRGFTRSDGQLSNGAVGSDQLDASLRIGFDPPAPWATATDYTTRSTVFEGYGFYLCLVEHTSGVFATDLAAGRWQLLADLTPPTGGLVASNNLSDLADAAAARTNLGLGTMAVLNSGTGSTQFRTNTQNEAFFLATTAIGATVQAYSANLDTLTAATITAAGLAILDDANAAAQRTTLGLGTAAVVDVIDEDSMATDSATRPPSQQSVKAYVDAQVAATPSGDVLHVREEKVPGADGGSTVALAWTTRVLNTVVTNEVSGASLAANEITLPAGTYEAFIRSPYGWGGVMTFATRLYNVTDAAVELLGSGGGNGGSGASQDDALVLGKFTLAGSKNLRLEYWTDVVRATDGLGRGNDSGSNEIFAEVFIRKVA